MASSAARNLFKVYVGNLPWTVGHNELKNYFSKFGYVNSAVVSFDKKTGLSRNHGFVIFSTKEGYEKTINTSDHKLEGNILRVQPTNNN
ncbi:SRA stem-loop-interacting RNA-binding protein, mitochondrial-like [Agrilus planipennis]|uniref:SRA stem-loop-interacting RNA-binding protein, mitochondrial-like n=1 Tax=Agrilus planipennis TaxID=224129 RepID=A0A1W4XPV8_AGRPL|nr:SRA stem-loop-interacting RNA-binding protein, mitochondrial-like [Agrilus planipennis]